jgi:CRP-like cAMP-binding protein
MLFGWSSDVLFRSDVPYACSDHRDMDEWSLALLSCKLNLIGVEAGGLIKRRGDKSEYAYILLGGAAKVRCGDVVCCCL